ncbi:MAG: polysaccharide deacetylase family protein [Lachnospiraceae bacterium]|nr:polysaccharide deacetylase family protein [Lachnospiraceae bacterium]
MNVKVFCKKIKKNSWKFILKNCLTVTICIGTMFVVYSVDKQFERTSEWRRKNVARMLVNVQVDVMEAEYSDGSGKAGKSALGENMEVEYDTPGWQLNEKGWWYASDAVTYYVNGWLKLEGKQYHFDKNGYMDTFWTVIGEKSFYFDQNGVYDPTMDSSMLIALTYDDGPSTYTSQLLDMLQSNKAKATFMMLGSTVEKYGAETIPRMVQLGCTLGNHSYDHSNLRKAGHAAAKKQFSQTDGLIAQYNNGMGATVIRFPYGEYTKEEAVNTRRPCFFWNVDTMDWDSQDANSISNAVMSHITGGNIILMHDIYQETIDASNIFIPQLLAQGYRLVTVEDLAAARGYKLEAGVTYFGFTDKNIADNTVTDKKRNNV